MSQSSTSPEILESGRKSLKKSLNEEDAHEEIVALKAQHSADLDQISLIRSPLTTLKLLLFTFLDWIESAILYATRRKWSVIGTLVLLANLVFVYFLPGSHQTYVEVIEMQVMICGWWIFLGILSSVGLGTGLHTFVLYLGPHIAKVTMVAFECGTLEFDEYGPNAYICPENAVPGEVNLWTVLVKVQLEALMWGIGTAIGELPPYFIARAARLAGQTVEELEELQSDTSLMGKIKSLAQSLVTRVGFIGILLFASIPNPLFDLAGLTCGHFLIPFTTFFGATLIGKAVIKAHIQTIFVITIFNAERLDVLVNFIETLIPMLHGVVGQALEKERKKLHRVHGDVLIQESKSLFSMAWDFFLLGMLTFFLISVINSLAKQYLQQKHEKELKQARERIRKTK